MFFIIAGLLNMFAVQYKEQYGRNSIHEWEQQLESQHVLVSGGARGLNSCIHRGKLVTMVRWCYLRLTGEVTLSQNWLRH